MGQAIVQAITDNVWFYILAGTAVALIIASFIVPPVGVIDSSVLAGVGEIFAFAALGAVIKAIDRNLNTTITKGNTTVSIRGNKDDEDKDQ